jgi:hypothetical protein
MKIFFLKLSTYHFCLRHRSIYSLKSNKNERVFIITEGGKADGN